MSGSKSPSGRQKRDGAGQTVKKTDAKASDRFSTGFDFLIINRPINDSLFAKVVSCVSKGKQAGSTNKKLLVAVITFGGLADAAYRTGRYLQSVYDEVVAFVPSQCKSAGTLLVSSAHAVIFGPFGELGPLDVQLRQKDEIFGRRSGLITRAAINDLHSHTFELFEHMMLGIINRSIGAISFKVAADISAKTTSEVMGRVYEQINPDLLGQDFRDLSVATNIVSA